MSDIDREILTLQLVIQSMEDLGCWHSVEIYTARLEDAIARKKASLEKVSA